MFRANRPFKGAVVFLVALLVVILIGCGGGGGGGGTDSSGTVSAGTTASDGATTGTTVGSGSVLYTLQWPVQTRAIPPYALSVVISAYDFGTTNIVAQQTVNRNNGAAYNQTVMFKLPPGKYTIIAEAKPNANGGGDTIASDAITTTIVNGQTTSTTLQFTSLVAKLFVDDLPSQAAIGQTFQVHAHAEDSQGGAILLPPAALDWTITAGGTFANITHGGQLTLLNPGSVTIQVRDIDTNVTGTKSITLVQGTTNGVIVIVS
jgi:hypothetical protein